MPDTNKSARNLLADRGWLPIYLASKAVVAVGDGNAAEKTAAIVELEALDESRAKAVALALMRPMLTELEAIIPVGFVDERQPPRMQIGDRHWDNVRQMTAEEDAAVRAGFPLPKPPKLWPRCVRLLRFVGAAIDARPR